MSQSTNNYTITLNGKDKMCLLNGDIGGILPHSVDFGQEEYVDIENGIVDRTDIPIKDIIRNAISYFGGELPENIIINDLDDAGYELMEYRADFPLYLFRDVKNNTIINCTIDEDHEVYVKNNKIKVSDKSIVYF
jgi:hypothetical protein